MRWLSLSLATLTLCVAFDAGAKDAVPVTDASPLIAYVQKPDPNYKWEVVKTIPGPTAETSSGRSGEGLWVDSEKPVR